MKRNKEKGRGFEMGRKRYGRLAAFVFLLTLCLIVPRRAEAADTAIPDSSISVNYDYETLTVTTDDDTVVYFTDSYTNNVEKWYKCEVRNGEASFDISWIKKTATVRLYLCGDVNTKVVSKDIGWQEKLGVSFTGTLLATDITEAEEWKKAYKEYPLFSEDTGYFIFVLDTAGRRTSYFDLATIEWRKGSDGVWRDLDELDLKEMYIRGITLNFRIKAVNDTNGTNGARTSTIAKISLARLSEDSGVKLETTRMEVSIKNGQEYSLDGKNWILIPTYDRSAVSANDKVTQADREQAISPITTQTRVSGMLVQELLGLKTNEKMDKDNVKAKINSLVCDDAETGFYIYIRTAGTKKKAASQITKLYVPFTQAPASEAKQTDLVIAYLESKTATGGMTITNNNPDYKYEFAVITPDEQKGIDWDNIDVRTIKCTSIKPGRTAKIAAAKLPKGSYLIYRIAGSEGKLPSTYVKSMEIAYDEVTYAGVVKETKVVGEELVMATSTNLTSGQVTCIWERCADIKAENPIWTKIAEGTTYTLTEEDAGQYVRVVIKSNVSLSGANAIPKASDPIGPIVAGDKK